ncbi:hypothetical protein EIL87_11335 [Saccharopolyspora rhizosphaerae]|uniref:Alpha/beta hydrolase n=1 Tax=Saccharopolyspora rhizosphaerae TaxID=2492662 RepID=A0A426JUX2_9PSEU|nr:hypothetical protein [Saccharopolyspora rhizosphaerae]RRO16881.1 hypothetical protein EIL87_11335 [Saccharopolyspora rhizosphaerae]
MLVVAAGSGGARGILLFGPGAGGDPARYQRLLTAASEAGFTVAAPEHERFDGRAVTDEQMRDRAVGLKAALAEVDRGDLPVVAAGHSAGGWAALCLAGAQPWGRDRRPVEVPVEPRISRLVLVAPTLEWFRGPGALDEVTADVVAMVGAEDRVTPPENADLLRGAPVRTDVRTYQGVGHLDFLSSPPPGVGTTPGLDHEAFLDRLTTDFVAALTAG